jgi:hypothetical protein
MQKLEENSRIEENSITTNESPLKNDLSNKKLEENSITTNESPLKNNLSKKHKG